MWQFLFRVPDENFYIQWDIEPQPAGFFLSNRTFFMNVFGIGLGKT